MDKVTKRLFDAARIGNVDDAQAAMDAGADVNARTSSSNFWSTPLHIAAAVGYTDITQLLLDNRADVNAKDAFHRTPLHFATVNGHDEIAALLKNAAKKQQGHADRVTGERKDKKGPQVGG